MEPGKAERRRRRDLFRYPLLIDQQRGVLRVTSNAQTTLHSEETTPSALFRDAGSPATKGSACRLLVSHAVAAPAFPSSPAGPWSASGEPVQQTSPHRAPGWRPPSRLSLRRRHLPGRPARRGPEAPR